MRLALAAVLLLTAPTFAGPPNVLLILADDLGFSDLGCYGGEIDTPNLDALAKDGLRFTQFANTGRCWPTRAAVLSGYYPQQVRRDTVPGIPSGTQGTRPPWAKLLPEMLAPAGYHSYHSGKWHVDGPPLKAGFEHSYSLNDHDRHFAPRQHTEDDKPLPAATPKDGYYSSTAIADHAVKYLKGHAEAHPKAPFFAFVAFTAPHFPVQAPADDVARYKKRYEAGWDALRDARWERIRRLKLAGETLPDIERTVGPPRDFPESIKRLGPGEVNRPVAWDTLNDEQKTFQAGKMAVHAAMVDRMDKEIGRILAQVKAMNAWDDTLVLFFSDNGASAEIMVRGDGHDPHAECGTGATFLSIGPGWSSMCNTPFRRHKSWCHEGGICTPFIAAWPKGIAARGELRHAPAHVVDLVPTLVELAGAKPETPKDAPPLPGRSLAPVLAKEIAPPERPTWWLHEGNRALRVGDWKLVALRDAPWELYDLSKDRSETTNLADKHPDRVKEMAAKWQTLADEYFATAKKNAPPAPKPVRPNVVIVMTDDQGLGDFSFTGNPVLKTPGFDAFAKEAVRLTDFHCSPMCSPTRGQLLTGLAALRNGATSVTAGRTFIRPGLPTLPEVFAKAGYKTALFGKWHLGDSYPHRPVDRGFHESKYHLGWGQLQSTPEFDWPVIDGRYFHNGIEKRYEGHATDAWFDAAEAWIVERKAKGEPFFCYLPTNAPHAPHIELDEYTKPYQGKGPAGFFGMIAHLDRRFARLDKLLTDQGLRDNTLVVFTTDNGGTAGVSAFNAGLRAGKTTLYEGGHRVPCWLRWPNGKLGEPRDIDVPTQNTDLLPTLCELCGVAPPAGDPADAPYRGVSLASLLRGGELAERTLVVQYGQVPAKHDACVIRGKWRLVKGEELYDVSADRGQKSDVAATNPEVVKSLRGDYDGWWRGVEKTLGDFVPQSIGSKVQPVVDLTCGEWENIYSDNSGHVREAVGGPTGGIWHIRVEEAGDYEFSLRRWPAKANVALGEKYEPSAKSPAAKANLKTVGFPTIAQAHVEIAGVKGEAKADVKETSATVRVTLPAGVTTMKAWFADAEGKGLCGAFFVTAVRK